MDNNNEKRVRLNLSMLVSTQEALKELAAREGISMSALVARWVHEKNRVHLDHSHLNLSKDTWNRLEQYAFENHTSSSQAVTDWIWRCKVKNENLRGQLHFDI